LSSALNRWEKLNAEDTWRTPREGWKEDVERMMREDQGVVLEMYVFRERDIVVNRKPWNKGVVEAAEWKKENTLKVFYARQNGATCDNYTKGARNLYFPKWEISSVSPPNILPTFLGLLILGPVPDEHAALIRE
jgi:hypothetical protein